jgi:hypothetical protein
MIQASHRRQNPRTTAVKIHHQSKPPVIDHARALCRNDTAVIGIVDLKRAGAELAAGVLTGPESSRARDRPPPGGNSARMAPQHRPRAQSH